MSPLRRRKKATFIDRESVTSYRFFTDIRTTGPVARILSHKKRRNREMNTTSCSLRLFQRDFSQNQLEQIFIALITGEITL